MKDRFFLRRLAIGATAAWLLGAHLSALAVPPPPPPAPGYCSDGTATGGITVADVTFGIPSSSADVADDCWGTSAGGSAGNDSESAINGLNWDDGLDDWARVAKTDGDNTLWLDEFEFLLSVGDASDGAEPWHYVLTWSDTDPATPPDLPQGADLVFVGKQANGFAAWLFEDIVFDTSGAGGGTFAINFVTQPGFSHASVYLRQSGSGPTCVPGECQNAPEPGSLVLLATGLAALASRARRNQS